jgi:inorganic pyrophosphatase
MSFPAPFYRWRPHPWHGLSTGPEAPGTVTAFIEITPYDVVKYEVDKETGYLKVDRLQSGSSSPPTLYGFIPRTYCGSNVASLVDGVDKADGDPLDICVLSERPIDRTEVIMRARVVGGIQMIDDGEADDKIIAVLAADPIWADTNDLSEVPPSMVDRIVHYFASYKTLPGRESRVSIPQVYGNEHAERVVSAAVEDYLEMFGGDDR